MSGRIATGASQRNAPRVRARGSTTQRGYGPMHREMRLAWAPQVETGDVRCARCGERIEGEPWDLGHTDDRTAYTGPEHARCNRADGARRRNAGYGSGLSPRRPAQSAQSAHTMGAARSEARADSPGKAFSLSFAYRGLSPARASAKVAHSVTGGEAR